MAVSKGSTKVGEEHGFAQSPIPVTLFDGQRACSWSDRNPVDVVDSETWMMRAVSATDLDP